jgi:hypothetical protein
LWDYDTGKSSASHQHFVNAEFHLRFRREDSIIDKTTMKRSGIMDIENTIIRAATPDDAEEILKIYAPYVLNTAITFEYEVPSLGEFRGGWRRPCKDIPISRR